MARRATRALPGVVAVFAMLAGLAGCAGIPTAGPVQSGQPLLIEPRNAGVPFIAEPPQRGASPQDVVFGFLRATADFRRDHQVARLYLTPAASQEWDPDTGTTVYSGIPTPEVAEGRVVVRAAQEGVVDNEGSYRRTPEGITVERAFRMEQVDGEWRIAGLDDGLLLSSIDVREAYRQVALYFLAPGGGMLVPDLVLLPQLPGVTTQVVSRLLRGPTSTLRGAVGTAFPQGTELDVQSVAVIDGVAVVRLDASALRADDAAREQMSAQLVWTLKQLGPEISRVRITAGDEDLISTGAPEQPRDSWPTYDPDRFPSDPSVYAVRDGGLGRIIEGNFEPLAGPAGSEAGLRSPAVSLDATRIAAVSADGETLLAGRIAADATLEPVAAGRDLAAPAWDPAGNLWFLDRHDGALWLRPADGTEPVRVDLPKLPAGPATGLALSRDGTRIALVSGSGRTARFLVGALSGLGPAQGARPADGAQVSVIGLREILPELRAVRDLAWADATTLVALGSHDGLARQPVYVSIDGYEVRDVEPLDGIVRIAAAPPEPEAHPLVAATTGGRLVQLFRSGRGWLPLAEGSDPAYPGG